MTTMAKRTIGIGFAISVIGGGGFALGALQWQTNANASGIVKVELKLTEHEIKQNELMERISDKLTIIKEDVATIKARKQ